MALVQGLVTSLDYKASQNARLDLVDVFQTQSPGVERLIVYFEVVVDTEDGVSIRLRFRKGTRIWKETQEELLLAYGKRTLRVPAVVTGLHAPEGRSIVEVWLDGVRVATRVVDFRHGQGQAEL